MLKTSKVLSYIFHPAFMPILGLLIIFNIGIYETEVPWEVEKYTYLIVALFSILLPLSILPIFTYFKLIGSIELTDRKERTIPLVITTICLIFLHIFLSRAIPLRIVNSYTFSIAVLSICLLLLNIFYKISMHLMALGGIIGLILAITIEYNIYPFLLLSLAIFLTGIIGSSRMLLKAHTLFQILSGFVIGLFTTYMLLTMLIR